MKIGLYFGSFNPIHIGHMVIANHIAEHSNLDEVWFVVTPHNPFKEKKTLLDNHHRLEMVYLATKDYQKLQPCNIEFNLPQPNYTVDTLVYLQEKYPNKEFSLIMGEDNLKSFHKWKNYDVILENHFVYVYPRISENKIETRFDGHKKIIHIDAPIMQLSSSFIRKSIAANKNIQPMIPEHVWKYMDDMNFYR
ncbi:nicotinate (nicotinamide) nucleotide adenylyltransferase [Tamlana sp. 2_MG-2023]|uniref:nicotinate (nicotinamide) nucleotide adenylyltransferase n=1 Tax=unclassified Tamlana TaxID=2614803 RepID=UPI0026E35CDE|nr:MULTISPECIES: nicotinate (nicotinamide) nucleotide adenylyltransferase [unclassified Tamlana]MDO6759954.1 nicotinate (nicotinamide) nucleotide adenylyltransferase [Tamlana sp. 2_MG-2023]MDO6791876.1 nicotinate (nicotinamide) nucleotide adenylyltransferase [Tamlana sp. 1_MG-2023]